MEPVDPSREILRCRGVVLYTYIRVGGLLIDVARRAIRLTPSDGDRAGRAALGVWMHLLIRRERQVDRLLE